MQKLRAEFEGRSQRSLFRDLAAHGYLSSYTHAGRYFTLVDIPDFDEQGLWHFQDIGFSRAGTLKETVASQVACSPAGYTHAELKRMLRVRVHNTLLDLVRQGRISRRELEDVLLYLNADADKAAEQVATRESITRIRAEALRPLTSEEIVETLVEALRAAPEVPSPQAVSQRLVARGVKLTAVQVGQVFDAYGLVPGKKTVRHT
jgi:hypothetical protein